MSSRGIEVLFFAVILAQAGDKQGDLQLSVSPLSSPVLTCCGSTYPSSSQQAETDWRQPFVGSRNTLRRDQIKTNLLNALAPQPKGFVMSDKNCHSNVNHSLDSFTLFVWICCARSSLILLSFYFSFDLKLFMSCWDLITTQLYPSYVDITLSWTWTSRSPQQSSIRNIL